MHCCYVRDSCGPVVRHATIHSEVMTYAHVYVKVNAIEVVDENHLFYTCNALISCRCFECTSVRKLFPGSRNEGRLVNTLTSCIVAPNRPTARGDRESPLQKQKYQKGGRCGILGICTYDVIDDLGTGEYRGVSVRPRWALLRP